MIPRLPRKPKLLVKYVVTNIIHLSKYLGNLSLEFRAAVFLLSYTGFAFFYGRGNVRHHTQNIRITPWVLGSIDYNVLVQCGVELPAFESLSKGALKFDAIAWSPLLTVGWRK